MAKHDNMTKFLHLCDRMRSTFAAGGVSADDVMATLPEARERVFKRLYGSKPKHPASQRRGNARNR